MIFIRSRKNPKEYGLPFQLNDSRSGRHPQYLPNDRVYVTYKLDPNRHKWIEAQPEDGFSYLLNEIDTQHPERTARLEVAFRVVECQHWMTANGDFADTLIPSQDHTILEAETDRGEEVFLKMLKELDPSWFDA